MSEQNLRATIVGNRLGDLSWRLQLLRWSTTVVPPEQIRSLPAERLAVYMPFTWANVVIVESGLWNDGVRKKIETGAQAKIVVAPKGEETKTLLDRVLQEVGAKP